MPVFFEVGMQALMAEAAASIAAGTAAAQAAAAAAATAAATEAATTAATTAGADIAGQAAAATAAADSAMASQAATAGATGANAMGANAGIMAGQGAAVTPEIAAAQAASQGVAQGGIGAGAGANDIAIQQAASAGMPSPGATPYATGLDIGAAPAGSNASELGGIATEPMPAAAPMPTAPNSGIATEMGPPQPTLAQQYNDPLMNAQPDAMATSSPPVADVPSPFDRGIKSATDYIKNNKMQSAQMGLGAANLASGLFRKSPEQEKYKSYDMSKFQAGHPTYAPTSVYTPDYSKYAYAVGGPVETMSEANAMGQNMSYPMANLETPMYTNPQLSRPVSGNVVSESNDVGVNPYTGEARFAEGGVADSTAKEGTLEYYTKMLYDEEKQKEQQAQLAAYGRNQDSGIAYDSDVNTSSKSPLEASIARLSGLGKRTGVKMAGLPQVQTTDPMAYHAAKGGIMHGLGGYSDGGRLLKGPGDGVSDNIPAVIGSKQPARLADGEFVLPARIVSEIGNGSTEAGARRLYKMMEDVQKSRNKSVGKGKVAVDSKSYKHLPK